MEPNFIIVPKPDPTCELWTAFPELKGELDDGDSGPYYIYARFADYLISRRQESQLWLRAYAFFESLATGGGDLPEILVVGIFEALCVDPAVANQLKDNLGPSSLKLLQDMYV